MERDPRVNITEITVIYFNSHAHVERDVVIVGIFFSLNNFNSHAHVERDIIMAKWNTFLKISTHTLTWSVTPAFRHSLRMSAFQLTRSRGAWHERILCKWFNKYFNSHAHVERDVFTFGSHISKCIFQLTRSRGAWHSLISFLKIVTHFNSHAHAERDLSMTRHYILFAQFQLTRSRGAWPTKTVSLMSLQTFQLTRSRGAWHAAYKSLLAGLIISTHTLTWSVTH